MPLSRFLVSSLLCVAVFCSVASTAEATTYAYTGHNFTLVDAPYTTAMSVTASFDLSITLGASVTDFDATTFITGFSAFDGIQSLSTTTPGLSAVFRVSTDAAGAIIDWISVFGFITGPAIVSCGPAAAGFTAWCGPTSPFGIPFNTDVGFFFIDSVGTTGSTLGALTAGTWTTVVPEPSTALLMGLGLVGLAGVRQRVAA